MLSIKRFAAIACAMLLAGCVTTAPPGLSADEIRSLKVVAVEGVLAPVAHSGWMSVTDEFRVAKGLTAVVKESDGGDVAPRVVEPDLPVAEFRAYVQREFNARVQKVFPAPLQAELKGTRPVRVIVRMHYALILSPGRRFLAVLLAGQSGDENRLIASVDVVDAASGKMILSLPQQVVVGRGDGAAFNFTGHGPAIEPDPMIRMLINLEQIFARWLLKRT